jgi:hypothetical protein
MKNLNKIFLTTIVCFPFWLHSQNWLWAVNGKNPTSAGASFVTVNIDQSILCQGGFGSSITFDTITYAGSGGFIAKYDANGNFKKFTRIAPQDQQSGYYTSGMNHDQSGNIFVTGDINGAVYFDTVFTTSFYQGYLAKFDSNLNGLKVNYISNEAYSNTFDHYGHTYVTGTINNATSQIDSFTLYNPNPNPLFKPQIFLARLDSSGNCEWVKQGWGGGGILSQAVHFNGSLYMLCRIDSCLMFDTASICNTNPSGSSSIIKTDTGGNILWHKEYTTYGLAFFSSISIDNSGNCYVMGWLDSAINIGGNFLQKTSGSQRNSFLVKYDSNGNAVWIKHLPCSGDILGKSITDSDGNTYVAGNFSGTAIFGRDTIIAQSNSDMFITRYNANGDCLGVKTVSNAKVYSIAEDINGNAVVAGDLKVGVINFDNFSLNVIGSQSFFLAKLSTIIDNISEGKTDVLPFDFALVPNPAVSEIAIQFSTDYLNSTKSILITDIYGKVVYSLRVSNANQERVDLSMVAAGFYFCTVSCEGNNSTKPFVKTN